LQAGTQWLLAHATATVERARAAAAWILDVATRPSRPFAERLNLIYLVNDVIHHSLHGREFMLFQAVEGILVPLLGFAVQGEPSANAQAVGNVSERARASRRELWAFLPL